MFLKHSFKVLPLLLIFGWSPFGQPVVWGEHPPHVTTDADLEKAMQSLDDFAKKNLGSLRSPKTPQEWQQLDRAAKKDPEACYRWLDIFSEENLVKMTHGKTWKDLGESDGVAACRRDAAKVADLQKKQLGANNLGSLGKLRSALSVYYGDHEGVYPEFLEQLVPKYIAAIPPVPLEEHPGTESEIRKLAANMATDTGGWGYVGDTRSSDFGTLIINCTHPHRGKPLADY